VQIDVDSVIIGYIPTNHIKLVLLRPPTFAKDSLAPGRRVLAHGSRNCTDAWQIWGNVALLDAFGNISFTDKPFRQDRRPKRLPARLSEALSCIDDEKSKNATETFVGKVAVALVRITAAHSRGGQYE
jgi:hypothetical protein